MCFKGSVYYVFIVFYGFYLERWVKKSCMLVLSLMCWRLKGEGDVCRNQRQA